MNDRDLKEALEHIAHIEAALLETSRDVKAIIAQLVAMEQRLRLDERPRAT
jgi:hypothetical protein